MPLQNYIEIVLVEHLGEGVFSLNMDAAGDWLIENLSE